MTDRVLVGGREVRLLKLNSWHAMQVPQTCVFSSEKAWESTVGPWTAESLQATFSHLL